MKRGVKLSKDFQRKLKQDNPKVKKLLTIEVEKHPKGVMVAGGVSSYGVGKLNFIIGAMDSVAYAQTLEYYKKDIEHFKEMGVDLIFQQDNSPCHVSPQINKILNGMNKLDFWPPNSPDLSPIESVWSEVQKKLEGYTFNSLDEMKNKIIYEWNRVPVEYCKKICDKFISDIQQIYRQGRIKEKHHSSKGGLVFKKKSQYEDKIENVVYNQVTMENIIKFNIKAIEKRNKNLSHAIKKLKSNNFKNQIKIEVNNPEFDMAYIQIVDENKDLYKNNEKLIKKLTKMNAEQYFNTLTLQQKIKFSSLAPRYEDDQDDDIKDNNSRTKKRMFKKRLSTKFIRIK